MEKLPSFFFEPFLENIEIKLTEAYLPKVE
jgi:hypothetical protein